MSNKIYYDNQYIDKIETSIVKMQYLNDKYYVELRDDLFFPGGGGQSRDYGTIDGINVSEIILEQGKQIYVLLEKPRSLEKVKCQIDFEKRFDYMQQHLAQHVISGTFYNMYNANTAGIHLGKDISYVDIVGEISKKQIVDAEKRANYIIYSNRNVLFKTVNREQSKTMNLRRKLQTSDEIIRIVEIENHDTNACCGVHPNSTLEIQMIKFINCEKHKNNTRIYFLAGYRAIGYSLDQVNKFNEICLKLSTGPEDVLNTIYNIKQESIENYEQNEKMTNELLGYELDNLYKTLINVGDLSIIYHNYENKNKKYLNKLVNKIIEKNNMVVLFGNITEKKVALMYAMSKNVNSIKANIILSHVLNKLNGKGGGNAKLAQGAFELKHINEYHKLKKELIEMISSVNN